MDEQPNSMTQPLADSGAFFSCHKCQRSFNSAPALRMHNIRKHGKGWNTSANFRPKTKTRAQILAAKRAYNKKYRARLKGSWSPERRARFNSTWRSKHKTRAKHELIVYPKPEHKTHAAAVPSVTLKHCPNCGEHLEKWRKE